MNPTRRGILKAIGLAPAVVAAGPALATQAVGYSVPGLAAAAQFADVPRQSINSGKVFTTFLSFLKDQEAEWREQSKNVTTVDPDIASMRLPLVTKVRMQAGRNFERRKALEHRWFDGKIARDGKVEVW